MYTYICNRCKHTTERSCSGWMLECECGGILMDDVTEYYGEPYLPNDNPKLLQARREALSRNTKLHRHIYQCDCCQATHEQHNYEIVIPCGNCGSTMPMRFTYVGDDEYNAQNGELVEKRSIKPDNNILTIVRKQRGLSQIDLAKMFSYTQQFISLVESGERPIPPNLLKWIG